MFGWFRRYFITGIAAILPIGITAWVLVKVFTAVDGRVTPLVARWLGFDIPGLGFAATILFVLLVGMFVSNIIGFTILSRFEKSFAKVPLVSRIYIAVKQIGEAVIASRRNLFERVVMFEYPRRGVWSIGFVTSEHDGRFFPREKERVFHVFLPTTPNPTSGYLLFLPESDVIELDISVEDGLKLVISGGAVAPPSAALPPDAEGAESKAGGVAVPEG